jgi:diacylglycerol kinase
VRIHIAAVFYVVIAGVLLYFNIEEWTAVALACGMVIGAELFNTAMEHLCNGLKPGQSNVVKTVKDMAAGAVLICAMAAATVAVIVLWEIWHWGPSPESLAERPAFWTGVTALPFWLGFIFWGGRKGKK